MSHGELVIGEQKAGTGNRTYGAKDFAREASSGVGLYFEKEVYSAFANPNAAAMLAQLVHDLGGASQVVFQVFGYCTGGYCVDAFAKGLAERGYQVEVVLDATAAIDTPDNGLDGIEFSRKTLTEAGIRVISTRDALGK
jgi:nicotinamidase-related amidase